MELCPTVRGTSGLNHLDKFGELTHLDTFGGMNHLGKIVGMNHLDNYSGMNHLDKFGGLIEEIRLNYVQQTSKTDFSKIVRYKKYIQM